MNKSTSDLISEMVDQLLFLCCRLPHPNLRHSLLRLTRRGRSLCSQMASSSLTSTTRKTCLLGRKRSKARWNTFDRVPSKQALWLCKFESGAEVTYTSVFLPGIQSGCTSVSHYLSFHPEIQHEQRANYMECIAQKAETLTWQARIGRAWR